MNPRRDAKAWLQRARLELAVPPARQVSAIHHTRLRRFELPVAAAIDDVHARNGALTVDLDRMVNRIGFEYGRGGWHPFVAALEEHLAEPDRAYEDSVLARYYDRFRPRNIHEVLFPGREVAPGTLATWPTITPLIDVWAVTRPTVDLARQMVEDASGPVHTSFVGPAEPAAGANHRRRVIEAYRRIAAEGYVPERHGYITGHFLVDGDDHRFVVGHGNHRMAALSLLGPEQVPVQLRLGHPPVVARAGLSRWTLRRGGLLEEHEAYAAFERFFDGDGRARARSLDLLGPDRAP